MMMQKKHKNGNGNQKEKNKKVIEVSLIPIDQLFSELESSTNGLSEQIAEERIEQYGLNEVAHEKTDPWYIHLIKSFNNPFIYCEFFSTSVCPQCNFITNMSFYSPFNQINIA